MEFSSSSKSKFYEQTTKTVEKSTFQIIRIISGVRKTLLVKDEFAFIYYTRGKMKSSWSSTEMALLKLSFCAIGIHVTTKNARFS